jgi:phenylacetate-CoA ligase
MRSVLPSLSPPATTDHIRKIQSERKRYAVAQARRAPFFKGKLDHVNIDRLDDPAEWNKVPILDKDMLRSMSDAEFYRDFCLLESDGDSVSEYWRSGGTTGRPLFYPRSHRDLAAAMLGFCRVFHCAGVKAPQRVHCAFPLGIHPAGQMMARAAEKCGLAVLMAGAGTTPFPASARAHRQSQARRVDGNVELRCTLPTLPIRTDTSFPRLGRAGDLLGRADLTGETREDRGMRGARLRDSFGMTEAGMMGAEEVGGFRL